MKEGRLPTEGNRVEAELIAGVRAGDERSARHLVEQHAGRMLAVAGRFLDDGQEAEDAVQDAFASAFASIDRFRGDAGLGTWLHRIVVNAALKRLRAAQRRVDSAGDVDHLMPVFNEADERLEALSSPIAPADRLLERKEIRELVRESIGRLPESHRAAILLRDIEGYSTQETAEALDLTTGAVKVRLHRARAALKRLLEPYLEEVLQ